MFSKNLNIAEKCNVQRTLRKFLCFSLKQRENLSLCLKIDTRNVQKIFKMKTKEKFEIKTIKIKRRKRKRRKGSRKRRQPKLPEEKIR